MPADTPFSLSRRALLAGAGTAMMAPRAALAIDPPAPAAPAAAARADGLPTVQMEARPSIASFQQGQETPIWAIGGRTPGPDVRLRKGEDLRVRLVNGLDKPLSLHWQGVRNASESDGVAGLSGEAVAPGAAGEIKFLPPDAGTFVYRPLVPGLCGELQERGVAGVLAVAEATPVPVDLDQIVAVDDWRLLEGGSHAPFGAVEERAGPGRLGTVLTVNGSRAPLKVSVQPGSRIRLRIASLCNARLMRIRFDGLKAYVVAIDSQPTDTFEPLHSTLPFAPGTRYDVIADIPADTKAAVVAMIGPGLPLVQVVAEGDPATTKRPALPAIAPIPQNALLPEAITLQKAARADVVIEGGARPGPDGKPAYNGDPNRIWTVNGATGLVAGEKPGKPLLSVKKGTPVVLALTNRTSFPQAIHVHGHVFRLLHAFDDGWEPYWLDTMILLENQTQRIAFVADNKGRWLIGSSVLERLDTGLSTWFEVT
jgi:FtsP/CotA-like multicopper oxidase with cupredoxin domain